MLFDTVNDRRFMNRRSGGESEREFIQVLERGLENRLLLDDFCMGIELTRNDCVLARRTSHATSINHQLVSWSKGL